MDVFRGLRAHREFVGVADVVADAEARMRGLVDHADRQSGADAGAATAAGRARDAVEIRRVACRDRVAGSSRCDGALEHTAVAEAGGGVIGDEIDRERACDADFRRDAGADRDRSQIFARVGAHVQRAFCFHPRVVADRGACIHVQYADVHRCADACRRNADRNCAGAGPERDVVRCAHREVLAFHRGCRLVYLSAVADRRMRVAIDHVDDNGAGDADFQRAAARDRQSRRIQREVALQRRDRCARRYRRCTLCVGDCGLADLCRRIGGDQIDRNRCADTGVFADCTGAGDVLQGRCFAGLHGQRRGRRGMCAVADASERVFVNDVDRNRAGDADVFAATGGQRARLEVVLLIVRFERKHRDTLAADLRVVADHALIGDVDEVQRGCRADAGLVQNRRALRDRRGVALVETADSHRAARADDQTGIDLGGRFDMTIGECERRRDTDFGNAAGFLRAGFAVRGARAVLEARRVGPVTRSGFAIAEADLALILFVGIVARRVAGAVLAGLGIGGDRGRRARADQRRAAGSYIASDRCMRFVRADRDRNHRADADIAAGCIAGSICRDVIGVRRHRAERAGCGHAIAAAHTRIRRIGVDRQCDRSRNADAA